MLDDLKNAMLGRQAKDNDSFRSSEADRDSAMEPSVEEEFARQQLRETNRTYTDAESDLYDA